ncbi:MAG: hypothetical protein DMG52_35585, partial [Acidobacteria bacterium]
RSGAVSKNNRISKPRNVKIDRHSLTSSTDTPAPAFIFVSCHGSAIVRRSLGVLPPARKFGHYRFFRLRREQVPATYRYASDCFRKRVLKLADLREAEMRD